MRRLALPAGLTLLALTFGLASLAALPTDPAPSEDPTPRTLTFRLVAETPFETPPSPWTERTATLSQPGLLKAGRPQIPTFSRSIEARGESHYYTLVGSDPFVKKAKKVVVPVQIVPARLEFDDGTVLDPTLPNSACVPGRSALRLVQESPLFRDVDYGDGKRQYLEQFRRDELWALTRAPKALNPASRPTAMQPSSEPRFRRPFPTSRCSLTSWRSGMAIPT